MNGQSATTDVHGRLPGGTWYIDPWHSSVNFVAKRLGPNKVRGRFNRVSGTVQVANPPERSTVQVTIQTASVSTGIQRRDDHLRSADFLDVVTYPEMRFVSTDLERIGDTLWRLSGQLTLHGVTRLVTLDVEWLGQGQDIFARGRQQTALSAHTTPQLSDFGIGGAMVPGTRLPIVGDLIVVDLEVTLLQYDPTPMLAQIPVD